MPNASQYDQSVKVVWTGPNTAVVPLPLPTHLETHLHVTELRAVCEVREVDSAGTVVQTWSGFALHDGTDLGVRLAKAEARAEANEALDAEHARLSVEMLQRHTDQLERARTSTAL